MRLPSPSSKSILSRLAASAVLAVLAFPAHAGNCGLLTQIGSNRPTRPGLSWPSGNAPSGAIGYNVVRSSGGSETVLNATPLPFSASPVFDDCGLSFGTTYTYRVRVALSSGGQLEWIDPLVHTTPPVDVAVGKAAAQGANSMRCSWRSCAGLVGYNVYRSTSSGGGFTKVNQTMIPYAEQPSMEWNDSSQLASGITYYYKVYGVNASGSESELTMTFAGTTPAPNRASVRYLTDVTLALAWTRDSQAIGYNVYRSKTPAGPFLRANATMIANPASGEVAFVDAGLKPCTTYYYTVTRVRADDMEECWTTGASGHTCTPGSCFESPFLVEGPITGYNEESFGHNHSERTADWQANMPVTSSWTKFVVPPGQTAFFYMADYGCHGVATALYREGSSAPESVATHPFDICGEYTNTSGNPETIYVLLNYAKGASMEFYEYIWE